MHSHSMPPTPEISLGAKNVAMADLNILIFPQNSVSSDEVELDVASDSESDYQNSAGHIEIVG